MTAQSNPALLFKEREAATRMAVSKGLLRKWRRLGQGPEFIKLGRAVRYSAASIEKFLRAHAVSSGKVAGVPEMKRDDAPHFGGGQ